MKYQSICIQLSCQHLSLAEQHAHLICATHPTSRRRSTAICITGDLLLLLLLAPRATVGAALLQRVGKSLKAVNLQQFEFHQQPNNTLQLCSLGRDVRQREGCGT